MLSTYPRYLLILFCQKRKDGRLEGKKAFVIVSSFASAGLVSGNGLWDRTAYNSWQT
jgi:hypothetical protein